jgi:hypothetical protein
LGHAGAGVGFTVVEGAEVVVVVGVVAFVLGVVVVVVVNLVVVDVVVGVVVGGAKVVVSLLDCAVTATKRQMAMKIHRAILERR